MITCPNTNTTTTSTTTSTTTTPTTTIGGGGGLTVPPITTDEAPTFSSITNGYPIVTIPGANGNYSILIQLKHLSSFNKQNKI